MMRVWDLKSPMVEHTTSAHQGRENKYSLKVEGVFKGNMQRQIKEGQMIGEYRGDMLLNRKGEWGQNLPPKFTMEDDDSFKRQEGRKRRQEDGCSNAKRQRRDGEPDSGDGDVAGDRQVVTNYEDGDRNNKLTDRDIVKVSPGLVQSDDMPFDSTKAPILLRDSGKIDQTSKLKVNSKANMISFESNTNKITNYFQLPSVSGGDVKGKVRQVKQSEVIKGNGISERGVLILKHSDHQALRKEKDQVVGNTRNSFSPKEFLATVDSLQFSNTDKVLIKES